MKKRIASSGLLILLFSFSASASGLEPFFRIAEQVGYFTREIGFTRHRKADQVNHIYGARGEFRVLSRDKGPGSNYTGYVNMEIGITRIGRTDKSAELYITLSSSRGDEVSDYFVSYTANMLANRLGEIKVPLSSPSARHSTTYFTKTEGDGRSVFLHPSEYRTGIHIDMSEMSPDEIYQLLQRLKTTVDEYHSTQGFLRGGGQVDEIPERQVNW